MTSTPLKWMVSVSYGGPLLSAPRAPSTCRTGPRSDGEMVHKFPRLGSVIRAVIQDDVVGP
eukprot:2853356-Pyramimonas_sp.AAC.1